MASARVAAPTRLHQLSVRLPDGQKRRLRPVGHAELGEYRADVRLDGLLGYLQQPGDLPVGAALGDLRQDLALAAGERADAALRPRAAPPAEPPRPAPRPLPPRPPPEGPPAPGPPPPGQQDAGGFLPADAAPSPVGAGRSPPVKGEGEAGGTSAANPRP